MPTTPTEPGAYWWRPTDDIMAMDLRLEMAWQVVHVPRAGCVWLVGQCRVIDPEKLGGEWGPRITSPAEEAMQVAVCCEGCGMLMGITIPRDSKSGDKFRMTSHTTVYFSNSDLEPAPEAE